MLNSRLNKYLLRFIAITAVLNFYSGPLFAKSNSYIDRLCQDDRYFCIQIEKGQTWDTLFPDPVQQDLVKRVNRINTRLRIGMDLAIPYKLNELDHLDLSPFPQQIEPHNEKVLIFNPNELAWAAYDENGQQVWWGPASGGRGWCPDTQSECVTDAGEFRVYSRRGENCVSNKFPLDKSLPRAKMPYCMFFNGGMAFHGSETVPGYNASHGCVRIFTHDAKWLHEEFINLPRNNGTAGTKVIVHPLAEVTKSS